MVRHGLMFDAVRWGMTNYRLGSHWTTSDCQCMVYYWYTGSTLPLQTSLDSLVRFGQMWSDVVWCSMMWSDAVISHTAVGCGLMC